MEIRGKRLLVLGGTRISCEIVQAAQKLGVHVGVADYNAVEDSPGKQIADAAYRASATDVDAICDIIKREDYDGVLTGFADVLLPSYARICEKAGLPCYGTEGQFETFIDKRTYKLLCRTYGVPVVEGGVAGDTNTEVDEFPVLVKPSDSSGSRGIRVCRDASDYADAVKYARSYSKTGNVLVERYIEGPELTVFWIFEDGECHLAALANRHMRRYAEAPIPLPVGYTFPSAYTEEYLSKVAPKVCEMLRGVGVKNGIMFMQMFYDGGSYRTYDIGFRLTGSLEYKLLESLCGFNPLELLIKHALTGKMGLRESGVTVDPFLCGRYGYNISFLMKPGAVGRFGGIEKVMSMPGVIDAVKARIEGESLPEEAWGELRQIALRVLGTADGIHELGDRMESVGSAIEIVSQSGENLLLPGFERRMLEGVLK